MLDKRIAPWYIFKMLSKNFVVIYLLFAILFLVFTFVKEVNEVNAAYSILDAGIHALLMLPSRMLEIIPIIFLITCIVTLGALANQNELVILRTSGFSIYDLVVLFAKFALLISFIVLLAQEFVTYRVRNYALEFKLNKVASNAMLTKNGIWTKDDHNFVFIGSMNASKLKQVQIFNIKDNAVYKISNINYIDKSEAGLIGHQVQETTFLPKKKFVQNFAHRKINADINIENLKLNFSDPKRLSLSKLLEYIVSSNVNVNNHAFNFFLSIARPLTMLVMVMIAIPVIIGSNRVVSTGARVMAGTLIGTCYYFFATILGPISMVFNFNPLFAVLGPIIFFGLVAAMLLRRCT